MSKLPEKVNIKFKVIGKDLTTYKMFLENRSTNVRYEPSEHEPDLIVFTGGADVNPKLYGEKKLFQTFCNDARDEVDLEAWDTYKDLKKVGICRGAQFLNVMNGGKLWQHVTNHTSSHDIINLVSIPGFTEAQSIKVTSTHHQMMRANSNGTVLAIAVDDSGISGRSDLYLRDDKDKDEDDPLYDTEVVWYEETQSLCYQPHPEFQVGTEGEDYFFSLLQHFLFNPVDMKKE